MDKQFSKDLKPGARVAVYIYGTPPIVTTATVLVDPDDDPASVWLGVDYTSNDQQLPQRYKVEEILVEEILGFLLPLAHVEHHPDGSTTGTIPLQHQTAALATEDPPCEHGNDPHTCFFRCKVTPS